MKSKRLAVLLAIFIFITSIVVLCSTIFTLQNIELNWLNKRNILKDVTEESITSNIKFPMGDSIFLINKEELKEELEKNNPYLQVVGLETTIPNGLVLHIAEREKLYAIKFNDNLYAVVDRYLKILEFADANIFKNNDDIVPVVVNIEKDGQVLKESDYNLCDFIEIPDASSFLKDLTYVLLSAKYSPLSIKGFIKDITLRLNYNKTILIDTTYGLKIRIIDAHELLTEKILLALAVYEKEHDNHNTTGTIEVFYNQTKGVSATYSA